MSNSNHSADLARFYMDWDGVFNFFGSRGGYRKRSGFGYQRRAEIGIDQKTDDGAFPYYKTSYYRLNWSAELLRKVSQLPVEHVLLSTWQDHFEDLIKATQWELEDHRSLPWVEGPRGKEHSGKVLALLTDQLISPKPFIWADDEAHEFYTDELREKLAHIPQLLLEPKEETGLTVQDLEAIEEFLAGLREAD